MPPLVSPRHATSVSAAAQDDFTLPSLAVPTAEAIECVKNKPKKNSVKRNANSRKMSDAVPTTKVR